MAVNVATLTAKLEADIRDFDRDMKTANRRLDSLEGNTSKASKGLTGMSTAMKAMAAAAAAAGLAAFGKQVVMLASDAEEAASAFGTTFGKSVDRAAKFVDEWALSAGFATHELEQLLATTGNIVQGIGATEEASAELAESMARLAGDVASFSNAAGGAPAVLKALQSAITGEREALKTYGIVLSEADIVQQALLETHKESADELTRLEKAQATVTLAYERAGKAVGDLERTQDGFANTLRRVNAEWTEAKVVIGQALLPLASDFLPVLSNAAMVLADFGVGLSEVIGWISALPGPVKIAAGAVGGLAGALALAAANPVVAGLVAVAGAITIVGQRVREHKAAVDDWAEAIAATGDEAKYATRELVALWVVENDLTGTLGRLGLTVDDLVGKLRGDRDAVRKVEEAYKSHVGSVDDLDESVLYFKADLEKLGLVYEAGVRQVEELRRKEEETARLLAYEVHDSWEAFTHDVEAANSALDDTAAADRYENALKRIRAAADNAATGLRNLWLEALAATSPTFRAVQEVEALQELIAETPGGKSLAVTEQKAATFAAVGALGDTTIESLAFKISQATGEGLDTVISQLEDSGLDDALSTTAILVDNFGVALRSIVFPGIPNFAPGAFAGIPTVSLGAVDFPRQTRADVVQSESGGGFGNVTINVSADMTSPGAAERFARETAEVLDGYRDRYAR